MFKYLLAELLGRCMIEEEHSRSASLSNILATISLIIMIAANYTYFFLDHTYVGELIMTSCFSLGLALIIKSYLWYARKKSAVNSLPALTVKGVGKIAPYLPFIIRYVPVALTMLATFSFFRNKNSIIEKAKALTKS